MLRATSHDCNLGERHTTRMSGMEMCVSVSRKGKNNNSLVIQRWQTKR